MGASMIGMGLWRGIVDESDAGTEGIVGDCPGFRLLLH